MKVTLISLYNSGKVFLAPTGAQGVTLSVRLSVCPVTSCLEQSIFIILAQINKQTSLEQSIFICLGQNAIREQSSTQRTLKEHSESTQKHNYQSHINRSLKYCVLFLQYKVSLQSVQFWFDQ